MTTNQTIDGVPRDDLELVLLHGHSTHEPDQAWDRLRALLDGSDQCAHEWESPALSSMPDYCAKCSIDRPAAQPQVEHTAVGFLERMLKGSGDDRLAAWQGEMAMVLDHIAENKPPAVPVIHITPEVFAMLRGERKMMAGGLTYSQSKPVGNWTVPLYAEQPAPVAVVLSDEQILEAMRKDIYEADGGYVFDTEPQAVIAAGRAVLALIAPVAIAQTCCGSCPAGCVIGAKP